MSFSLAVQLGKGEAPVVEAALLKDLGSHFDQELPAVARDVAPASKRAGRGNGRLEAVLRHAMLYAPSYTIRSGPSEVLRGITARG